jgi:hypothetical protein
VFSDKVDGSGTIKKALSRERGELMSSAVGCGLDKCVFRTPDWRATPRWHQLSSLSNICFQFRFFCGIAIKFTIECLQRESVMVVILRDNTLPGDAPHGGTRELLENCCSLH